jgi:hypothetical protein
MLSLTRIFIIAKLAKISLRKKTNRVAYFASQTLRLTQPPPQAAPSPHANIKTGVQRHAGAVRAGRPAGEAS